MNAINKAAVQAFQSTQPQADTYTGDFLVSFHGDVVIYTELEEITLDMNVEA